ncbi:MAG: peptide deformylase [Melioribacteraceae bacterium]|nr:peptide deformylase [Melioribacteraceae bacterium]MCF8353985.1 peptide deformylase [Melioribacteraceae bacterium]MCF8393713.1 peptide deformylase [Melioribacteraceae bacterium]MCF8419545.1 peptide deformylase [Melioribacteraceae bacterium]
MSVLPITVYGDRILREKTKPVEKVNDEVIENIRDMFETMRNAQNGIGLAANQVGLDKSIFVIDLSIIEEYEKIKPVVMINPEIISESDELINMEEGCLSLPNMRADVIRPESIRVRYLDTDENIQEIDVDDFYARVILHEYDHLIGKMIPDRVVSEIKKKLQKDLLRIMKREIEVPYPITER